MLVTVRRAMVRPSILFVKLMIHGVSPVVDKGLSPVQPKARLLTVAVTVFDTGLFWPDSAVNAAPDSVPTTGAKGSDSVPTFAVFTTIWVGS